MMKIQKLNPTSILIIIMGLCFTASTMVDCRHHSRHKKSIKAVPIETKFELPAPIPKWPSGEGFASETIDLGGLQVSQVSSFKKIWAAYEGGADNLGASFYEPTSIPDGFFMLGCYSQPNNQPLFGWVLAAKDITDDPLRPSLKTPTDYTLVWTSASKRLKQDGVGYIWLPTPPDGYKAVGHVVTTLPDKPPIDKIRCVRSDLTEPIEIEDIIWGPKRGLSVYSSRPVVRGTQALGVPTGTFIAQKGGYVTFLSCLKNVKNNLSAMPNLSQIQALVEAYSPVVYYHPKEQYYPSSVGWFFENGALLYSKGQESSPVPVEPTGLNLPQDPSNDSAYWLDLPIHRKASDRLKKGDIRDAEAYLHIKPIFGATFTDIAVWIFYPFNGAARAKVEFVEFSLGKIGEHVGDWEHVTLRVSNFNGELKSVFFSQHSKGTRVSASELEFDTGNKPVVHASLHGHAAFPRAGLVLQGKAGIGIRNDIAKGEKMMDTGARYLVVAAEHLVPSTIVEPPWLNYARRWGPKISYNIDNELKIVEKLLTWNLKEDFEEILRNLPPEVLGEQGPFGPKVKDNWSGDEWF